MKTKGAADCNALEVQPLPLLVDKYWRRWFGIKKPTPTDLPLWIEFTGRRD